MGAVGEFGIGVVGDDGRWIRLGCTSSTSIEMLAGRGVQSGEAEISTSCVAQGLKRSSFAVR